MLRPQQYPMQPPQHHQSLSQQRSVSPPLPSSPKAYPQPLLDPRNNHPIDPRTYQNQTFQPFPQGHPQNYFPSQAQNPPNIQNSHNMHIPAHGYNSKPISPTYNTTSSEQRIYHSQSVHVSSPKNLNANNFQPNQNIQGTVHFNYSATPPLQNSNVQPLPEPINQVIPAPPR